MSWPRQTTVAAMLVLGFGCKEQQPPANPPASVPSVPTPAASPARDTASTAPALEQADESLVQVEQHRLVDPNRLGDIYSVARAEAERTTTQTNAEQRLAEIEAAIDRDLAEMD